MVVDQDHIGADHAIDVGVERMLRSKRRKTGEDDGGNNGVRRSSRQGTKKRVVYNK